MQFLLWPGWTLLEPLSLICMQRWLWGFFRRSCHIRHFLDYDGTSILDLGILGKAQVDLFKGGNNDPMNIKLLMCFERSTGLG